MSWNMLRSVCGDNLYSVKPFLGFDCEKSYLIVQKGFQIQDSKRLHNQDSKGFQNRDSKGFQNQDSKGF